MDLFAEIFDLLFIVGLLAFTYITGSIIEKRHYASIREREGLLLIPILNIKDVELENTDSAKMISANTVVASDYFKRFLASLRNIFGGNVSSLESLMDRARRESVLKLKEQSEGAAYITNLRYQTSTIANGMVEVIAYATVIYKNNENSQA